MFTLELMKPFSYRAVPSAFVTGNPDWRSFCDGLLYKMSLLHGLAGAQGRLSFSFHPLGHSPRQTLLVDLEEFNFHQNSYLSLRLMVGFG